MKTCLLVILAPLLASTAFAISFDKHSVKTVILRCENQLSYPSVEFIADASVLTTAGQQTATMLPSHQSVSVETVFDARTQARQMTLTAANSDKLVLIEVRSADDVANAWDGAGTLAYGETDAVNDYNKAMAAGTGPTLMLIQKYSSATRYPKPGGYCSFVGVRISAKDK